VAVDSEHKTALTPARSVSAFAGEIIRGDAMDTKKPQQIPTQPTIDMLLEFACIATETATIRVRMV
jgi:hypothetical protein